MSKKKNTWSNVFFIALLIAMIIPQSRMFIQSNVQRLLLRAPSNNNEYVQLSQGDLNYRFQDENEQLHSLSSLSDKPILLNYWATWCPPCVAELPSIAKLYADYKDKVHFVLISNEEFEKTRMFMEKKGYELPVARGIQKTPEPLERSSIPSTFLISKSGKILVAEVGANDWNHSKFRSLLDKAISEE